MPDRESIDRAVEQNENPQQHGASRTRRSMSNLRISSTQDPLELHKPVPRMFESQITTDRPKPSRLSHLDSKRKSQWMKKCRLAVSAIDAPQC